MTADDYAGRTPEARDNTLVVAELNAERKAIYSALHARLQEQGALDDGVTVPLLVRVHNNADLGRQTFWEKQTGNVEYYRVGETDAENRVDQDLTADARFMAGKTPEMLWPVINGTAGSAETGTFLCSPKRGGKFFSRPL